jgi:hypothetical protein
MSALGRLEMDASPLAAERPTLDPLPPPVIVRSGAGNYSGRLCTYPNNLRRNGLLPIRTATSLRLAYLELPQSAKCLAVLAKCRSK